MFREGLKDKVLYERQRRKEESPVDSWRRSTQDSKDFQCKSLNVMTRWRTSKMTAGMFKAKEERKNIVKI